MFARSSATAARAAPRREASPATSELDRRLGDPRDACPAGASRADGCLRGVYESESDADGRDHRAGLSVRVGGRRHTEPGAARAIGGDARSAGRNRARCRRRPRRRRGSTSSPMARSMPCASRRRSRSSPGPKVQPTVSARCSTAPGAPSAMPRRSSAARARWWSGVPATGTDSTFIEHPGGSLIQDRSLFPGLQERVLPGNNVLAFRASLSILGLGFVEAIDSNTIAAIAQSQPAVDSRPADSGAGARGAAGRRGWAVSAGRTSRRACCRSGRRLLERDGHLDAAAAARAAEQRPRAAGGHGSVPR